MIDSIYQYYHVYDVKLGEGGFAKVKLASHIATKQLVAIKCLDKVKLQGELPRIYNEIECLKVLKHQHIARLLQVFETETHIYFVLEHCPGGELFDYIVKKKRLEEPESAQIIYDLMRVLDYIHLSGFAHRDLKPENVLFNDRHQIKLIDFGLAANCTLKNMSKNKNQPPIDQLRTCCGSVTYAAPEVISGEVYAGQAVDVWSAGVMLYAMLVGQVPFNDQSISRLYMKIKRGICTLPTFLSIEAQDLLRRMLITNPKQRITVPEILAHPWLRNRINPSSRIARRPDISSGLDENVFDQVCQKFPNIEPQQLQNLVLKDFNYFSATYWLLQTNSAPRTTPAVRPTPLLQANSPALPRPNIRQAPRQQQSKFATITRPVNRQSPLLQSNGISKPISRLPPTYLEKTPPRSGFKKLLYQSIKPRKKLKNLLQR